MQRPLGQSGRGRAVHTEVSRLELRPLLHQAWEAGSSGMLEKVPATSEERGQVHCRSESHQQGLERLGPSFSLILSEKIGTRICEIIPILSTMKQLKVSHQETS